MSYFRRGFRSFGYRPRFGYRRGYNRYWRRRGFYRRSGTSRAQSSANRRFKLVVPKADLYGVNVPQNTRFSLVHGVSPLCSNVANNLPHHCIGNLYLNESFVAYSRLYDEVKIDWVSVSIECMENIGANVNSVIVHVSCDRRASYNELNDNTGQLWPTPQNIAQSASATLSFMNSTTKKTVRRFFAASDLIERNQFIDTDFTINNGVYMNQAFFAAGGNPNFFCPSIQFCIQLPTVAPAGGYTVPFAYAVKWGVTFRGPKFSSEASASKSIEVEDKGEFEVSPVKVSGAGKVEKPTLTGMAKDVVARLALNVSDNCDEYVSGENDWHEDLEFLMTKVGIDGVRAYFPEGVCKEYDDYLKERGVMDDDPTELVKDSKS